MSNLDAAANASAKNKQMVRKNIVKKRIYFLETDITSKKTN